jgi:membrane protein DedA with SNARE-associated domain
MLLGCACFCAVVAGIGWAVGSNWNTASHDLRYVDVAVAVLVVGVAGFLLLRRRSGSRV